MKISLHLYRAEYFYENIITFFNLLETEITSNNKFKDVQLECVQYPLAFHYEIYLVHKKCQK